MCAQGVKLKSVTNSIGMKLIGIPAGKFTMGSPEDEEYHQECEAQVSVTLTKPFRLGKTAVTQGQWKSVTGTTPWDETHYLRGRSAIAWDLIFGPADKDVAAGSVTYFEAVEFCDALTEVEHKAGTLKADEEYRLPTEAEWEYACRAGTTTAFSFGDEESEFFDDAWFNGKDPRRDQLYVHKVGLKKPNPWGLHDMHGNVVEWCSDWYDGKLIGGVDPIGPEEGSCRVGRGGGWWCYPGSCRSANRNCIDPSGRSNGHLGFRVARSQSVQ